MCECKNVKCATCPPCGCVNGGSGPGNNGGNGPPGIIAAGASAGAAAPLSGKGGSKGKGNGIGFGGPTGSGSAGGTSCAGVPESPDNLYSPGPISYANGQIVLAVDHLRSTGFGLSWGHSRAYKNGFDAMDDIGMGYGWWVDDWPTVISTHMDPIRMAFVAVLNHQESYWFDLYTLAPLDGTKAILSFDQDANVYILLHPNGTVWEFSNGSPAPLSKITAPGGQTLNVLGYTAYGHPTEIQRTCTVGGSTVIESYLYDYNPPSVPPPPTIVAAMERVKSVTLRRQTDGGAWENLRQVCYTYYGMDDSGNPDTSGPGDQYGGFSNLKTATEQHYDSGAWVDDGVYYYRYNPPSDFNEPTALRFVVHPRAYAALAADPQVSNPLTATDDQVAQYADCYYEGDIVSVSLESVEGGQRQTTFSYTGNGNPGNSLDYNAWTAKTTETRADGSQVNVYTNFLGQVLLREHVTSNGSEIEYSQYDSSSRLVLRATPGAIASYVDNALVQYTTQLAVTWRDNNGSFTVGLVKLYDYYATTDLANGAVAGYLQHEKIQQGRDGTPILLRSYQYTSCTASNGATVYPVSQVTSYASDDGTGAIQTGYSYSWYSGTAQMRERVTSLPAVSSGQNGPGASATRTEQFDTNGNLVWLRDERGFITYYQYDPSLGVVTQTIEDVDGSQLTLPTGWTTPAGGGLHLVTDYTYDSQGRLTQSLGPAHTVGGLSQFSSDENGTVPVTVRRATWNVYQDTAYQVWSAQGFLQPDSGTYTLVNPVSVTLYDVGGAVLEQIQLTLSGTLTFTSVPCPLFPVPLDQSTYVRWTTYQYDAYVPSRLASTCVYHAIPASGSGSAGTNYDQTTFAYDWMGRRNMQKSPGGTITRTVFDQSDRAVCVYVGTDDTGATDLDPSGGNEPCQEVPSSYSSSTGPATSEGACTGGVNNMVLVSEYVYISAAGCTNCGGGGSEMLAGVMQHVDPDTFRLTEYLYDWRNRRQYILPDEDDQGRSTFTYLYYDNLDRPIRSEQYQHTAAGAVDPTSDPGTGDILIARSETSYDALGRAYQTKTYAVDPATGTVGNSLVGNTWYDLAGNPIKQQPQGTQQFTKTAYDSLGRAVVRYTGYDVDETSWTDAGSVSDDTILEQAETVLDPAGNVVQITHYARIAGAAGTGGLTSSTARVTYRAAWYDGIDRPTAAADYGTNGGSAPSVPSTPPASSDTVLVTTTQYDHVGMACRTIDPTGKITQRQFDAAGRVTATIDNYVTGTPSASNPDQDVTVTMTYNADGKLLTLTASNPTTGDQTTQYVYGTDQGGITPEIYRTDLLRAEIYPDSDNTASPLGNGPSGVYNRVEYLYNRQGERIQKTDQNGTVHAYDYDPLGRLSDDCVTSCGSGIDSAVLRISLGYEVRGMVESITSYDNATVGSGNVVNEVVLAYDETGRLESDSQEHAGAVGTSTLATGYSYDQTASSGVFTNGLRPTSVSYPNGRLVDFTYGAAGSTEDVINRLAAINDDNSGTPGAVLAQYTYLGLGTIVVEDYPSPQIKLNYDSGTAGTFAGLDQFGRVIDQRWQAYGTSGDADRYRYGYDLAGNRLWRANALTTGLDEHYTYDGVNRLTIAQRGTLASDQSGITGTPVYEEDYTLDMTGNFSAYVQQTAGTVTLNQTRTHNTVNELTAASSWATPAYDLAGNATALPDPSSPTSAITLTYDAWNRLVEVTNSSGIVEQYAYDGTNRRIQIQSNFTGSTPGTVQDDYYNGQQVIQSDITADGVAAGGYQYAWSPRYIDAPILRDTLTSDGTALVQAQRVFYLSDANYNVTGPVKYDSGAGQWTLAERYGYDPYGVVTYRNADWTTASSSANWNTVLYTGRTLDPATGLYYYRARYYDAALERLISRDPISYKGNDFNLYAYCNSNPVVHADPSGRDGEPYGPPLPPGYPGNPGQGGGYGLGPGGCPHPVSMPDGSVMCGPGPATPVPPGVIQSPILGPYQPPKFPIILKKCVKWGPPLWKQLGYKDATDCANHILCSSHPGPAPIWIGVGIGIGIFCPPAGILGLGYGDMYCWAIALDACNEAECLEWKYEAVGPEF
jgi:RHS repeat-associated protein